MNRKLLAYGLILIALVLGGCNLGIGPNDLPPPVSLTTIPIDSSTPAGLPTLSSAPVPVNLAGPDVGTMMTWVDDSQLVFVPGSDFVMGASDNDNPVHTVTLSPFWIYRTKVTNRLYALCVAAGKCSPPTDSRSAANFSDPTYLEHPVVGVNWDQADTYCRWVKGHLPTEAQWEKTARGPKGDVYPWGDGAPTCDRLNFNNCIGATSKVRDHLTGKSYYEALDMAGNVFEWVQDWYAANYYLASPKVDPPGPSSGTYRTVRSSQFASFPAEVVSAKRLNADPKSARADLGFRCVVDSPSVPAPYCETSPRTGSDLTPTACQPPEVTVGGSYCSQHQGYVNLTVTGSVTSVDGGILDCQPASAGLWTCRSPQGPGLTSDIKVCGNCANSPGVVVTSPQCPPGYVPSTDGSRCVLAPGTTTGTCTYGPLCASNCPLGTYWDTRANACVPPGHPTNDCIDGYTLDSQRGCCQPNNGGQYPGCGPNEVYDLQLGCVTVPSFNSPGSNCVTISASTLTCGITNNNQPNDPCPAYSISECKVHSDTCQFNGNSCVHR